MALPLIQVCPSPPPLAQIGQVVLVLAQLVSKGDPGLLNVLAVVCWPVCDEGRECFDVLYHDLPGSANLLLKWTARDWRSASQNLGARPCPLKLQNATGWTPPLWSRSLARRFGKFETAQFYAPLPVLSEALLESANPPSSGSGVINAKISHHCLYWWVCWAQELG